MATIYVLGAGHEDAVAFSGLVAGLRQVGYQTCCAEDFSRAGPAAVEHTRAAIELCDAIVLLLSPRSVTSSRPTEQYASMLRKGRPLVAVLVDIKPGQIRNLPPQWHRTLPETARIIAGFRTMEEAASQAADQLKSLGIYSDPGTPTPSSLETSSAAPEKPLPRIPADAIPAARDTMEAERRQVTVLFADVVGFTSMSEKLDPEDTHALISEVVDLITQEVHRYEGTIAQFLGDGVMALFGAPIAREDAPLRALHAAMGIRRRLGDYAKSLRQRGIEFNMRIGLNSGLVVVGRIGDDFTMEFTAMGDTVNVASRMQSTAQPGTIRVSEDTRRLAEGYFEFKPLGHVRVKGRSQPVKAYELKRISPAKTRFGVSMARGLTPFVGRQNDVRQLIRCFDLAMKGQGQVVGIVGEAGVGKSRLLRQMIESLPPDQFLYLEGECLHYGETVPYFPMLSILKSYFGIEESDAPSAAIKKVQQKIRQLDGQLETMTGAMCDLLSLNVEDSEYASLKPQEKRERAFEAIKTLLLRESRNQPLLIVIEDLQWIDRTSEEFLGQMIPRLPGAPIMLVLLYRPEYVHPWTSKAHYTQIRVDEMSPETSADMVEAILKGGIVTPELKQLILSHGLGNPLFIEEFIRTLIEKGHIRWSNGSYILTPGTGQMQVPETIEGIISSRIDNLKDSVKKTLQVSSVVGREFSAAVLQMTMGMSAGIKEALDELQELELIYEKNLFPETEYTFKHALTQDVAYNSLLIRSRRVIHQKVGRAIETLYPQRREELCETLAHHYSKAEDMEKAYEYSKLSGDKAYRNSSMSEALRRYREALAMLDHLPDTERNKVRALELTVLAWQPMLALGFREGSLDILKKGQRLAEELGDKRRLTQLYGFMAHYLSYTGDSVQGYEYAGKALAEAERTGDIESAVWAATNFIGPVVYRGDFAQAASVSARAVDLIEKAGEAHRRIGHGIPLYPTLIAVNGLATGMLGEFKQGEPLCERIVRVAAESGDASVMAVAEVICGLISAVRGKDIAACQKHLQDAIHYSQQSGFGAWLALAWTCLGWSHWLQGTLQPAWDCAQKAISIYSETEQRVMLSLAHLLVGAISLDSADVPNALNSTEEALKLSQACGEKHVEGRASCWHGRVLSMADVSCRTAAEEEILRGIDLLAEMRIRPWQAEGHLLAGEHYLAAGDQPKALSRLTKAQGMFQEMEMTHWLARAQRALAAIPGAGP